uniref:AB hydrolase-1 domain-containing protein n=1 Tax=Anguilla anguilla TaxID=7936 RepID=A0A0E9P7S7_ANGAN
MLLYVLWAIWGEHLTAEGVNVACMDFRGSSAEPSKPGRARDSNCILNTISPFLPRKPSSMSFTASGSSTLFSLN